MSTRSTPTATISATSTKQQQQPYSLYSKSSSYHCRNGGIQRSTSLVNDGTRAAVSTAVWKNHQRRSSNCEQTAWQLQNNIGAILLEKHYSIDEARERFLASLLSHPHSSNNSGTELLLTIMQQQQQQRLPQRRSSVPTNHGSSDNSKNDVSGLIWFYNKLQREIPKPDTAACTDHPMRSHGDVIEQLIPLGLEYMAFPISVTKETDAHCAAWLNLANLALEYPQPRNHCGLKTVLKYCQEALTTTSTTTGKWLQILRQSNSAVLKFAMGGVNDALQELEMAQETLQTLLQQPSTTTDADDDCTIPREYIHFTIQYNLCRVYIRVNDLVNAQLQLTAICNFSTTSIRFTKNQKLVHRMNQLQRIASTYLQGLIHQKHEHHSMSLDSYHQALTNLRDVYGHSHYYVAVILEQKGALLFESKTYTTAMLSLLTSLKVYESHGQTKLLKDRARVLYTIGRTLHDREEYTDAMTIYHKALQLQYQYSMQHHNNTTTDSDDSSTKKEGNTAIEDTTTTATITTTTIQAATVSSDAIAILTNIARIHHIMGNLPQAIHVNSQIIEMATLMITSKQRNTNIYEHAFIRNQCMVLGNLHVEYGSLRDAMILFSKLSRTSSAAETQQETDTSVFAIRATNAERLGSITGSSGSNKGVCSHAAAA